MPQQRVTRTGVALAALSAACFVSVTSENLPVALLPDLAAGFDVSESAVGLLVTGYAVVVAVTVVPLVALTSRWDRRTTALITIAMITASNLLLAAAPVYAVALVARLVSAVGHGVFWSVVAPMAARLLGLEHAGRATAVVFAGNSLAFLFGLPLCSWLGATIGWRATVLAMAGLAAISALVVRASVAPMPSDASAPRQGPSAVRSAVTDRSLLPVNVATVLVVLGHYAAFTYITVIIADYVDLDGAAASSLLLVHGAAGLVGLVLIGRLVDRRPHATALLVTSGLAACMLALLVLGPVAAVVAGVAVVAWGLPAAGIGVVLQAAVLRAGADRPDLASAVYIVAFQVGIAVGAVVGGVSLDAGALPVTVAAAAACGLAATLVVLRAGAFRGGVRSGGRAGPRPEPVGGASRRTPPSPGRPPAAARGSAGRERG